MTQVGLYNLRKGDKSDNAYTHPAKLAFKNELVQNSPTFASLQHQAPEWKISYNSLNQKLNNYG
jgi:hypothetical protein